MSITATTEDAHFFNRLVCNDIVNTSKLLTLNEKENVDAIPEITFRTVTHV